jgi:hypothetical protein
MVVDFSRNTQDFPLPNYIQYVPTDKTDGKYLRMTIEVAGRMLDTANNDTLWPDGTEAPMGFPDIEKSGFYSFRTERHCYAVPLGELAVEQADWELLATQSRIQAQRAMTARTQQVITLLTTQANWDASNTSLLTSMDGVTGQHDLSTTARKDIKRSFDVAASTIQLGTLSSVKASELIVVVGPDWARKVSVSQEIVDHIKGSPIAIKEIEDGLAPNSRYGLPNKLYGYTVVVEDTSKVTSRKGATRVAAYVLGGDDVVMVSRPGGLIGREGAPSFSTATCFLKEEMTVESRHDRNNRRHEARVVENFDPVLTAPVAGFYMRDCLS